MFFEDAKIDFHEFGPLRDFEIVKIIEDFLLEEHANGSKYLLVITGKGKVVRPIVEEQLKLSKFVESYKRAGYFNGQGGAFEVVLKE